MKFDHTPGPWISKVNHHCSSDLKGCWIMADGINIADVSARNVNSQVTCEFNARLIAAAPEMLKELRKCFKDGMEGYQMREGQAVRIKNILESATGKIIEEILKIDEVE